MQKFLEEMEISSLTNDDIMMMSPLKLAYIGDSIYEMYIRTYVIHTDKSKVNKLNRLTVSFVNATAQGYAAKNLEAFLTNDEWTVLKRGRNQKSTPPKNANMSDYRYATGLEALIGYLYLKGMENRLIEVMKECIRLIEKEKINGNN